MSYVINMVGGSGGFSPYDAILRVVAPAGSTVTVSKGGVNKTLPAFAMSGSAATSCYYYVIKPSAFNSTPWTVTATNGGDTDSNTIVINAAGEYIMQLSYWDGALYYAGDEATDYTGGFETFCPAWAASPNPTGCTKGSTTLSVAFTTPSDGWYNGGWGTVNKVDFTGFTTLHVLATSASNSGNTSHFAAFGVQGSDSSVTEKHTQTNYPGTGTLAPTAAEPCTNLVVGDNTLDISALSEGFVWFGASARGSGSCNVVVTKIWLS